MCMLSQFYRLLLRPLVQSTNLPDFDEIFRTAEETLFRSIISNHNHVLFRLLPPQCTTSKKNIFGVALITYKYRQEFTI